MYSNLRWLTREITPRAQLLDYQASRLSEPTFHYGPARTKPNCDAAQRNSCHADCSSPGRQLARSTELQLAAILFSKKCGTGVGRMTALPRPSKPNPSHHPGAEVIFNGLCQCVRSEDQDLEDRPSVRSIDSSSPSLRRLSRRRTASAADPILSREIVSNSTIKYPTLNL